MFVKVVNICCSVLYGVILKALKKKYYATTLLLSYLMK